MLQSPLCPTLPMYRPLTDGKTKQIDRWNFFQLTLNFLRVCCLSCLKADIDQLFHREMYPATEPVRKRVITALEGVDGISELAKMKLCS